MSFFCQKRKRSFSSKRNLILYFKRSPCCNVGFFSKSGRKKHIIKTGECFSEHCSATEKTNALDKNVKILDFESKAEFLLWKNGQEQKTLSKYVQMRQAWVTCTGKKKFRYRCLRNRYERVKHESTRKRHIRSKSSCQNNDNMSSVPKTRKAMAILAKRISKLIDQCEDSVLDECYEEVLSLLKQACELLERKVNS